VSRRACALGGLVLLMLLAGAVLVWASGERPLVDPHTATPATSRPPAPFPTLGGVTLAAERSPVCQRRVQPFIPTAVAIPGVTRGAPVLAVPRDADGVPGVPPLTTAGKAEFAWDRPPGIRPGERQGNVLLNAHTWPDGTALGNHLLAGLHEGDRIVVRGRGRSLCYRVTDRVSVPADAAGGRYYDRTGRPRLAIVVCSGTRLGPGDWTERTLWFASPTAR
jgi:hypothetical protein